MLYNICILLYYILTSHLNLTFCNKFKVILPFCFKVQYDLNPWKSAEKEKSPRGHGVKIDKVQIETQNNIIIPGRSRYVDRTGLNRDNSPRGTQHFTYVL